MQVLTVFSEVVAEESYNELRNYLMLSHRKNEPLERTDIGDKPKKVQRCCPYNFDSSFCRVVDDRLLCGYNRNVGQPESRNDFKELADGCRMRGDRVECGYIEPPFANTRRPPAVDTEEVRSDIERDSNESPVNTNPDKLKAKLHPHVYASTADPSPITRCVETSENRIVCHHV